MMANGQNTTVFVRFDLINHYERILAQKRPADFGVDYGKGSWPTFDPVDDLIEIIQKLVSMFCAGFTSVILGNRSNFTVSPGVEPDLHLRRNSSSEPQNCSSDITMSGFSSISFERLRANSTKSSTSSSKGVPSEAISRDANSPRSFLGRLIAFSSNSATRDISKVSPQQIISFAYRIFRRPQQTSVTTAPRSDAARYRTYSGLRKIFSIFLPFANSSISLSRYRIFRINGSSMFSTRMPHTTPVIKDAFGFHFGAFS